MMLPHDVAVLIVLVLGSLLLAGANVALQRLARPDRGSERITGCCGMPVPSAIADPPEGAR